LTKWKSTHPGVLEDEETLNEDLDIFKEVGNVKIFEDHGQVFEKSEKVLGLSYSFDKDVFSIWINDKYKQPVTTRRQMMGLTSCVFDPLGFFCPFVLKGKFLFHKATNLGLDWDDPLPEDIRIAFDEWRRQLPELQNIQIPRWVATQETARGEKEIHTFCDASEEGYGFSIYESTITPDGTAHTALIFAKARLVPNDMLKQALKDRENHHGSIPRLELVGAHCRAEESGFIRSFSPDKYARAYWWADSECVLK
jgi:hypothetical protein